MKGPNGTICGPYYCEISYIISVGKVSVEMDSSIIVYIIIVL